MFVIDLLDYFSGESTRTKYSQLVIGIGIGKMQGKVGDNNMRYFIAISENKRKDMELRGLENKIDVLQKKMLSRYWKEKISVFDDMIRLNVKTPSYDNERATSALGRTGGGEEIQSMALGPMSIDSKLLSNRPVTLQKGNKNLGPIQPVISIEGTDAVCYPNKEAKRGRKVGLGQGVLRRLEQCKTLEENIARCKSATRRDSCSLILRRNGSSMRRPKTAPGKTTAKSSKPTDISTDTENKEAEHDSINLERKQSIGSSFKREGFITAPLTDRQRPSTPGSVKSHVGSKTPR